MNKKIALVFPGQGSQYVGMGKELYDNFPKAKEIFNLANDVLKYDIIKLIFEGPEETLRQTQVTQLAIYITSMACLSVLVDNYPSIYKSCQFAAGHSLGEYSALCSAKVFDYISGLNLVKARAEFIRQAGTRRAGTSTQNAGTSTQNAGTSKNIGSGGMAAVIGLEYNILKDICSQAKHYGTVEVVNFNCPGQLVIAGETKAVEEVIKLAGDQGALKAVKLNVSGPFHSSLMESASKLMAKELEKYSFNKPALHVVANCDASVTTDTEEIKSKLISQINHPVLWEKSIRKIIESGIDVFIEVGPGKVLSGLIRRIGLPGRIDRSYKTFNVEDKTSLEKVVSFLDQN